MSNSPTVFRKNVYNVAVEGKLHKVRYKNELSGQFINGYLMELKDGLEVPCYCSKALQIFMDKEDNGYNTTDWNTFIVQYQTTREPPYIKLDKAIGIDNTAKIDDSFTIKCKVFGVYKNIQKLYNNKNFILVKLKNQNSEDFVKLKCVMDDNVYQVPSDILDNLVTKFIKLTLKRYDSNLVITNLEPIN